MKKKKNAEVFREMCRQMASAELPSEIVKGTGLSAAELKAALLDAGELDTVTLRIPKAIILKATDFAFKEDMELGDYIANGFLYDFLADEKDGGPNKTMKLAILIHDYVATVTKKATVH